MKKLIVCMVLASLVSGYIATSLCRNAVPEVVTAPKKGKLNEDILVVPKATATKKDEFNEDIAAVSKAIESKLHSEYVQGKRSLEKLSQRIGYFKNSTKVKNCLPDVMDCATYIADLERLTNEYTARGLDWEGILESRKEGGKPKATKQAVKIETVSEKHITFMRALLNRAPDKYPTLRNSSVNFIEDSVRFKSFMKEAIANYRRSNLFANIYSNSHWQVKQVIDENQYRIEKNGTTTPGLLVTNDVYIVGEYVGKGIYMTEGLKVVKGVFNNTIQAMVVSKIADYVRIDIDSDAKHEAEKVRLY